MTSAQVVETSINHSPTQNYTKPDDRTTHCQQNDYNDITCILFTLIFKLMNIRKQLSDRKKFKMCLTEQLLTCLSFGVNGAYD